MFNLGHFYFMTNEIIIKFLYFFQAMNWFEYKFVSIFWMMLSYFILLYTTNISIYTSLTGIWWLKYHIPEASCITVYLNYHPDLQFSEGIPVSKVMSPLLPLSLCLSMQILLWQKAIRIERLIRFTMYAFKTIFGFQES